MKPKSVDESCFVLPVLLGITLCRQVHLNQALSFRLQLSFLTQRIRRIFELKIKWFTFIDVLLFNLEVLDKFDFFFSVF